MDKKILQKFRQHPGEFLSGERMSDEFKISRAALWKHIEKLRALGYIIEAMPRNGYILKKVPDRLYPDEVSFGLRSKTFGQEIVYLDITESTNKLCFKLGLDGKAEGTVVLAEAQTSGKGRMSRQWISPKYGGIYMSILLRPDIPPFMAPQITLVLAVSVATALRKFHKSDISIKWPNDILLKNKKLGGILTEMDAESDKINFIVLGVGINVNSKKRELPAIGTSLFESDKKTYSRVSILQSLLFNFEKDYKVFLKKGFSSFKARWSELSSTLSKQVKVKCMNREFKGLAIGIDIDGALILKLENGEEQKVLSGDVFFL
ncbi:MAG: biotin--[acetyl-CoA-carboxylase] ligase [Candidatus Omnitrophota bacterium]